MCTPGWPVGWRHLQQAVMKVTTPSHLQNEQIDKINVWHHCGAVLRRLAKESKSIHKSQKQSLVTLVVSWTAEFSCPRLRMWLLNSAAENKNSFFMCPLQQWCTFRKHFQRKTTLAPCQRLPPVITLFFPPASCAVMPSTSCFHQRHSDNFVRAVHRLQCWWNPQIIEMAFSGYLQYICQKSWFFFDKKKS